KLVLGLRVVRFSDGGKVPYGLALGRSLAELISLLPPRLGFLWVGLTPSKRAWHDYLCDTRVVHAKPE
ncbi:MAG: RDD family protein, partial [Myxococcales bacterium]|nr:RDD family protein [Myxococcales bacterium]